MSKHTPGPFWTNPHQDREVYRGPGWRALYICQLSALRDEAERDELVDLLNKGTHFEGMLAALKEGREALDHFADLEVREYGADDPCQDAAHALVSIDAAIAKAEEEGE